ncbi:hypothetical protein E0504_44145 [Parafrankia sp. BMG5.11]|nr:hypothetical protein E0504_44145 [Parafrankia sp. BMG5.11]
MPEATGCGPYRHCGSPQPRRRAAPAEAGDDGTRCGPAKEGQVNAGGRVLAPHRQRITSQQPRLFAHWAWAAGSWWTG